MSGKACVVGSINYDIIINQSRFAEIGETLIADSLWLGNGGKGANQAVQLAKMEVDTILIGAIGNDLFAQLILKELKSYGVQLDCVSELASSSGLGVVINTGEGGLKTSIIPGANALLSQEIIDSYRNIIQKADILLYQLEIPLSTISHSMSLKHSQSFTILNAAPFKKLPDEILSQIDCLVLNETEASQYYGTKIGSQDDAVRALRNFDRFEHQIIITLGSLGVVAGQAKNKIEFFPAHDVEAIETTGAGDSFIGAFAAHYLNAGNFFAAIEYANLAASITVQTMGGQRSMPRKSQMFENVERK